jgi:hypothetical protein
VADKKPSRSSRDRRIAVAARGEITADELRAIRTTLNETGS